MANGDEGADEWRWGPGSAQHRPVIWTGNLGLHVGSSGWQGWARGVSPQDSVHAGFGSKDSAQV